MNAHLSAYPSFICALIPRAIAVFMHQINRHCIGSALSSALIRGRSISLQFLVPTLLFYLPTCTFPLPFTDPLSPLLLLISRVAQGVLSWVAQPTPGTEPAKFEARLYEPLFKSPNPAELGDAWLDDLNPESLTATTQALAPPRLANARVGDR